MEEQKLIELCYNANKDLYAGANNPLRSHGPDHHKRVCDYALLLSREIENERKIEIDREVIIAASFLHDLAAYYPDEVGDNYHDFDHVLAEEALKSIDFPAEKIALVINAIKNHGSDTQYKKQKEPIEVTIIRDADKMDVFGPIGVSRIIMVRTLKGDNLHDIVDDFVVRGHLKRKYDSITTEQAKKLTREDYKYSKDFFDKLALSIL